jgi:spoIIIJ-associated protein
MIKVEAVDIQSAILEASNKLGCSYKDVDYHVLQEPISAIFGIRKRNAIIVASIRVGDEKVSEKREKSKFLRKIFGNREEIKESVIHEIKEKVVNLLAKTCFEIDTTAVSFLSPDIVQIYIDGKDAPLLIGREGYRYKAINYVLQNWITQKYNLKLQLEIGEFIKKQSESVDKYLENEVYDEIEKEGYFKTKILDDILIKIAIRKLREKYKNKYVKVRNTQDGSKFIVVDDFFTKKI